MAKLISLNYPSLGLHFSTSNARIAEKCKHIYTFALIIRERQRVKPPRVRRDNL